MSTAQTQWRGLLQHSRQTPERSLGDLFALYEHRVCVRGKIWSIDSFDQCDVECGKQLAKKIEAGLASEPEPELGQDRSTNALIRHYRGHRRRNRGFRYPVIVAFAGVTDRSFDVRCRKEIP